MESELRDMMPHLGGMVGWRLPEDIVPTCHALSRDGERVLIGASDGRILLVDRRGAEIWRYSLKDRVESVLCAEDCRLFLAGTWGGEVSACINEGLVWSKELSGVIGNLAVSAGGERIAAASWAGQITTYRRDGTPNASGTLHDAVVTLAVHATGAPLYLGLADHTLLVLDSDGRERWRRVLDSRLCHVASFGYDVLVATEAGTLLWFNDDGVELRRREVIGGVEHVAASRDGSWVAWVDRRARLTFWQPARDQGFKDFRLQEPVDALAVTGQGDGVFCSVALPSAKIVTFNRYRRELETRLPQRVRSASFSGSGTSATALSYSGETVFYVELVAVKDWLPPPRLSVRVTAGDLVKGQLGTITLDITNEEGCRAAHNIEVTIASEFVAQSRTETAGTIKSGDTSRVVKAVEPLRAGKVPILVSLSYEDELKKRFEERREEFVKVIGS